MPRQRQNDNDESDFQQPPPPPRNNRRVAANAAPAVKPDARLWSEKYAPRTMAALSVNRQKVDALRRWFQPQTPTPPLPSPALLVTGPVGCGKTTAIRLVAQECGWEVVEWVNPVNERALMGDRGDWQPSEMRAFQDFLQSGSRYQSLMAYTENQLSQSSQAGVRGGKQVLLIKDFPNVSTVRARGDFQQAITATVLNARQLSGSTRFVFIMTDAAHYEQRWSLSSESVPTPDLVFGKSLLTRMTVVHLNPLARTYMEKLVKHVFQQEWQCAPKKQELDEVVAYADGDMRKMLNYMQFQQRRRVNDAGANEDDDDDDGSGNKCTKYDHFHTLGKILHAKRIPILQPDSRLPAHLRQYDLPRLDFDLLAFLRAMAMDHETLTLFTHENLPQFLPDDIETYSQCMDLLCDGEVMSTWAVKREGLLARVNEEMLVRAMVFHLGMGKKRMNAPAGTPNGGGFRKIQGPSFYAFLRKQKEMHERLAMRHVDRRSRHWAEYASLVERVRQQRQVTPPPLNLP